MRIMIAAVLIFLMAGVATYIAMSPSGARYRAGDTIPDVAGLDPAMVFGTTLLTAKQPAGDGIGETGLQSAAGLGVRTIIGVDIDPLPADRVADAESLGIRVVHLPMAYDGIDGPQRVALAKAVADLPTPIMIICRTGRHLAPAAAAMAMVCVGTLGADEAVALMQRAGVSESYTELYDAVRSARELDRAVIDASGPSGFRQAFEPATLHDTMWLIQTSADEIRLITENGGDAPAEHPAADARSAAIRLDALFASLVADIETTPNAGPAGEGYAALMRLAADRSGSLRLAIESDAWDRAEAGRAALIETCLACHATYR